ncbi:MAG: aminopeptidase [Elusimicrobia bacterium]|nr:aminopeptidase [Elusimicrobiota bacterium]
MRRAASPAARIVALVTLVLAFEACSPAYLYKSWRGHRGVVSRRRPIETVLADPSTPPDTAAKLRLVLEVRAFAAEVLGMPPTKNYADFVALDRPYVTYAVTACPKTSLDPYEWWFPFVGRVPYKGYFDRADALKEAAALERRGHDTLVGGIRAYSTLGWLRDPLLSSMLDVSPGHVADTLLHEMTHAVIYFKSSGDFNESVATFVGQRSALDFLNKRFGPESAEANAWASVLAASGTGDAAWEETYRELETLYRSRVPEAEKLEKRKEIFARAAKRHGVETINNAVVRAHRRYHENLGDFQAAHERLGGDWRKTLSLLKSLDKRRPRQALRDWLSARPGS